MPVCVVLQPAFRMNIYKITLLVDVLMGGGTGSGIILYTIDENWEPSSADLSYWVRILALLLDGLLCSGEQGYCKTKNFC